MHKKCKVVLIPTNKAENCFILHPHDKLTYYEDKYFTQQYLKVSNASSSHLYILSDEEIKEGDMMLCWEVYTPALAHINQISKCVFHKNNTGNIWKKIIASTDSLLNLPDIPHSFIETYIAQYNKGNKIEEVEVEYEEDVVYKRPHPLSGDSAGESESLIHILKVNKDNSISIKPVKSVWTREELTDVVYQFASTCAIHSTDDELHKYTTVVKWINDNL